MIDKERLYMKVYEHVDEMFNLDIETHLSIIGQDYELLSQESKTSFDVLQEKLEMDKPYE
tara:strand:+ start:403 stop:582 length:180 start_codon:yes stop_codon:yes gene_type:complete